MKEMQMFKKKGIWHAVVGNIKGTGKTPYEALLWLMWGVKINRTWEARKN